MMSERLANGQVSAKDWAEKGRSWAGEGRSEEEKEKQEQTQTERERDTDRDRHREEERRRDGETERRRVGETRSHGSQKGETKGWMGSTSENNKSIEWLPLRDVNQVTIVQKPWSLYVTPVW